MRVFAFVLVGTIALLALLPVPTTAIHPLFSQPQRTLPHLPENKPNGGGIPCAACTILLGEMMQDAVQNDKPILNIMLDVCKAFGQSKLKKACDDLVTIFGPLIVAAFLRGDTPDEVCQGIKICTDPTCKLYQKPFEPPPSLLLQRKGSSVSRDAQYNAALASLADLGVHWGRADGESTAADKIQVLLRGKEGKHRRTRQFVQRKAKVSASIEWPWDWVIKQFERPFAHQLPLIDRDNDTFASDDATFRGYDWRGFDIDDRDPAVHPGVSPAYEAKNSPTKDMNCNGITGIDPVLNKPYEELFCANSQPRGVIMLGDSASAHFHIPANFSSTGVNLVPLTAENEGDWPQCSWSTGFKEPCPNSSLPLDSFYQRLKARNRCNKCHYVNLSVNGARSTGFDGHDKNSLSWGNSSETTVPAIVFLAMSGNDVCVPEPYYSHMTPPKEFYSKMSDILAFVDTKVPPGSFVVLIGLEYGLDIWDTMAEQIHPVGVNYAELWNYTDCLQVNPCWGWLNPNATIRNKTQEWADSLDQVLVQIQAQDGAKYKNFELIYLPNDIKSNLEKWKAAGKNPVDLYEWIGGGHPSQTSQMLTAADVWATLETKYPHVLGPVNPFNINITQVFGEQGPHC